MNKWLLWPTFVFNMVFSAPLIAQPVGELKIAGFQILMQGGLQAREVRVRNAEINLFDIFNKSGQRVGAGAIAYLLSIPRITDKGALNFRRGPIDWTYAKNGPGIEFVGISVKDPVGPRISLKIWSPQYVNLGVKFIDLIIVDIYE